MGNVDSKSIGKTALLRNISGRFTEHLQQPYSCKCKLFISLEVGPAASCGEPDRFAGGIEHMAKTGVISSLAGILYLGGS